MASHFTDDMYMEILSRTSLTTLDAMRCTSKEYEKLTYDPDLLNLHKQRNNIVSGFLVRKERLNYNICEYTCEFVPSHDSNGLDLGFLPCDANILASSDQGIMVFESPDSRFDGLIRYHVCKPATKQILALPNPKTKYRTEKVVIVVVGSKPLHYKIVRLSEHKRKFKWGQCTSYRCEIFDSRAWTWRLKAFVILPFHVFILRDSDTITTRGSIYMLLDNNEVLKFDAYSEKWTTFSSPIKNFKYPFTSFVSRNLVKYKGKLGFACIAPSQLSWEIWVLTIDESWEKLHVLDTKEDIVKLRLMAIYDSDTWLMYAPRILLFYSFKRGAYTSKFSMSNGDYWPCRFFPYRSDFEPADLKSR